MMRLFRRLADEGRSIICITHNVDNVEQCHLILVLARGKLMFYGPPAEAPAYFGVSRISEIYDRLNQRDSADWEQQFCSCALLQGLHRQPPGRPEPCPGRRLAKTRPPFILPGTARGMPAAHRCTQRAARRACPGRTHPGPDHPALRTREWLRPIRLALHQFVVLTVRYLDLVISDPRGLRLLLLQAPIVAVFLLAGFIDKDFQTDGSGPPAAVGNRTKAPARPRCRQRHGPQPGRARAR